MKQKKRSIIEDQPNHPGLAAVGGALKAARVAKGLSQRALSQRTGIPQSHVSKIENAGADLRLTSLLTLAHALDLDLALIHRKLMPAVEGLQRQAAPDAAQIPAYRLNDDEEDNDA